MKNFTLRRDGNRIYGICSFIASLIFLALNAASSAQAACVATPTVPCLSDQPIQSANSVKPNVMFILDNSGSMKWDVMSIDTALDDNVNRTKACRKNFQYNTVYYNPNFNYIAAVPKRPDPGTGAIVSMPAQAWPNALTDPFTSAAVTNLSTSFEPVNSNTSTPQNNAQPAYYYKFTGAGSPGSACDTDDAHYTKVIVSSTSCVVGGDVTTCPNGADERNNFANWYSYFRTRIKMMKSGMATTFSTIDDSFRVGFHTINNPSSNNASGGSLNIMDFSGGATGTPKGDWYDQLFKINPDNGTPLQNALSRVGNYYRNSGTMTGLSGDPVQYSCQKNFSILSTDGYWNTNSTTLGNVDMNVPASMPVKEGNAVYNIPDTGLTPGAAFPRPYREGPTAVSNSLADVAMYYWVNDLRTSGGVSANNVPTASNDPAYWQHMNTFSVGLGVNGTLAYPTDLPALASGSKDWPDPVADTLTAVDDLWHAAVNGRGQYYKATDPATLSNSLTAALKAISDASTYGVGPASSTNDFKSPGQTDFTTYVSSYKIINWSGDVKKYALDPTTGIKTGPSLWSASKQLDSKVNPGLTSTVNASAYTTRNIVTRKEDGTTIPFIYTSLSATQQAALCYKDGLPISFAHPTLCAPTPADAASLVNYLRGDASFEGDYGVGTARFRNRHDSGELTYYKRDLIGSIVNASPSYVAVDPEVWQETNHPGYGAFQTATKTRSPTLYVPANDGMVHAFDAATGGELWAYIPSFIIPEGNDDSLPVAKEKGLRALSYQDGGAPAYNHHFYVDATPFVQSVDFARTGGDPSLVVPATFDWHTIMVGGLGKGGKGYYALDVTIPATGLADAQTKVLWEFPSAGNASHAPVIAGGFMGYSYGTPLIIKSRAYGWVVIVSSGYSNTDGFGYVFLLNAKTGDLLETLKTPSAAPGMAYVTTVMDAAQTFVTQVYSGDLNGNIWRFDFDKRSGVYLTPRVSQIFSSSTATPITSELNITIDENTGHRWIFFGTGQYLDVGDRSTAVTQYIGGLRDGGFPTPITPLPAAITKLSDLTPVTNLLTGLSAEPALGWKYMLPNSASDAPSTYGQRAVSKPFTDLRTVLFITLIPTTDPCSPGITGYVHGLDYSTGRSRLYSGTTQIPNVYSSIGFSGAVIQTSGKTATSNGKTEVVLTKTDGTQLKQDLDKKGITSSTRHISWREVLENY